MENKISEVLRSLPRGFRFDPTDEELLIEYLKPKILGQPGDHNIIPEIDARKLKPKRLEQRSTEFCHKFNSKDLFFFCRLKPKQSKNERHCYDRKTRGGYWKVNSTDRLIRSEGTNAEIGIMKTLRFYKGNLAKNESSNWVCHEYHLNHNEDKKLPPYVVCRIKNKREKKLKTAQAPTISPEGCSSRPQACTSNVSETLVNQEGNHSSICNTINNEVAGNQEAVNAQLEMLLEEHMNSLSPILDLPDYNNILTHQPRAEAEDGSSYIPGFPNDNLRMPSPCSDPARRMPEHFSTTTRDNG